jgi:hypothetical protein
MTEDEVNECMTSLSSLFPSVNDKSDAELLMWRDQLRGQDAEAVKGAILAHKLAARYDRVTFPDILDRVREAKAKQTTVKRALPDESFADVLRKHEPKWRGCSDYNVILRYHWGLWQRAKHSVSQLKPKWRARSEAGYRKQLRDACFNYLVTYGMVELSPSGAWDFSYAGRCADAIFESAEFFRTVLDEVAESAPVTKESPVVDHDVPLPPLGTVPDPTPPTPQQALLALAEHELNQQREEVTV